MQRTTRTRKSNLFSAFALLPSLFFSFFVRLCDHVICSTEKPRRDRERERRREREGERRREEERIAHASPSLPLSLPPTSCCSSPAFCALLLLLLLPTGTKNHLASPVFVLSDLSTANMHPTQPPFALALRCVCWGKDPPCLASASALLCLATHSVPASPSLLALHPGIAQHNCLPLNAVQPVPLCPHYNPLSKNRAPSFLVIVPPTSASSAPRGDRCESV